jgi:hypothetical protein
LQVVASNSTCFHIELFDRALVVGRPFGSEVAVSRTLVGAHLELAPELGAVNGAFVGQRRLSVLVGGLGLRKVVVLRRVDAAVGRHVVVLAVRPLRVVVKVVLVQRVAHHEGVLVQGSLEKVGGPGLRKVGHVLGLLVCAIDPVVRCSLSSV